MIKKKVTYYNEDGFNFVFEPLEDTLKIKKIKNGYESRYLVRDDLSEGPGEFEDTGLLLVNYHRDFWVENKDIITEDDLRRWYQGEKIEQEKDYHIFPLACLIHSGVWLSLGKSFITSDPGGWDTSHVGAVLVSKKEAKTKKQAIKLVEGLIGTWNQFLTGEIYCIVKEVYGADKSQKDYDVVGGYYGTDYALKALQTDI